MPDKKKNLEEYAAKNGPVVIERTLNAPSEKIWKALTDKTEMKRWYFDLAEFKPETGFEFQFYGGKDEKQYLHLGVSYVTFELFPEGNKTKLKLTHAGLETFPPTIPTSRKPISSKAGPTSSMRP